EILAERRVRARRLQVVQLAMLVLEEPDRVNLPWRTAAETGPPSHLHGQTDRVRGRGRGQRHRRGSVSDGAQRQAPPTEQTCRRRPGRKRDPHRLLPRSGGTAVLRVLERAVPQQGEGIQRRPLPCVVPLEPPAGDPTRITAAAGAIDPLTTRSQPGSELLK